MRSGPATRLHDPHCALAVRAVTRAKTINTIKTIKTTG